MPREIVMGNGRFMVALDKNGKPTELPPLILETPEEMKRNAEAKARRESRLNERKAEKG